jgi:predicted AAA+ superfamily ATPase
MGALESSGYFAIGETLRRRLQEPSPGRIQLLVGPRQVGKTTLLQLLTREHGDAALYIPADAPEAALPGWWEALWQQISRDSQRQPMIVLLDEIQYIPDWSRRLKAQIDLIYRENLPIHVVVTGSATLHLGAGARETMAGRFERLVVPHWPAVDLARAFGLSREEAVETVVRWGSFPGAWRYRDEPARWRTYVLESIIDPAIGRDLLALELVRKPALLRQVFAISAGHPCEIVAATKIAGWLLEGGDTKTIAHYLQLLQEAFLVASVHKYAQSVVRQRSAPPKLVPLSNAFLAATTSHSLAMPPPQWGRWVENACLAHAINAHQQVWYWRDDPLEVDAVLDGTWGKWAIEIKTGRFNVQQDLRGLLEFCRRTPDFRPLVLCDDEYLTVTQHTGIPSLAWREFLWSGVESLA